MKEIITYCSDLSDRQFKQQFEQLTLSPDEFSHKGHLRIAWLYLQHEPLQTALDKVCMGIRRYAESLGATDKYHHTLTAAIVRLMAVRMKLKALAIELVPENQAVNCGEGLGKEFVAFLNANPDLVIGMTDLLASHYRQQTLHCEEAKQSFVAPDLAPIE